MTTEIATFFFMGLVAGLCLGLQCALASARESQKLSDELAHYKGKLAEEARKTSAAVIAVKERANAIINPYESPQA